MVTFENATSHVEATVTEQDINISTNGLSYRKMRSFHLQQLCSLKMNERHENNFVVTDNY